MFCKIMDGTERTNQSYHTRYQTPFAVHDTGYKLLGTGCMFPALGIGYMFSRAWHRLHVSRAWHRLHVSRAWHRLHVFPRLAIVLYLHVFPLRHDCFIALFVCLVTGQILFTSISDPQYLKQHKNVQQTSAKSDDFGQKRTLDVLMLIMKLLI